MRPITVIDHIRATSATDDDAEIALDWLAANGFPADGDETWRYTSTGALIDSLVDTAPPEPALIDPDEFASTAAASLHPRLVMVNGRFDGSLSELGSIPPGLSVRADSRARTSPGHPSPVDGFDAMNRADGAAAVLVTTEDGAEVGPLHVVHLSVCEAGTPLTQPRLSLHAGSGSRVEIVEVFEGAGGPAFTNAVTSIDIAAGAEVSYQRAQLEGPDTTHVGRTIAHLDAGSTLRVTAVDVGASQARHSIQVGLEHRDATIEMAGLCAPVRSQRHDTYVEVQHRASWCQSSQLFKGVIDGHARGSFTSRVVVAAGTTATDASQLSQNLVLSPTAQVDTRPWLEIFSDEVRCTHGATVGRLDDDAIFYLRSRGIDLTLAKRMLLDAFTREILDSRLQPQVRAVVEAAIAANREEQT